MPWVAARPFQLDQASGKTIGPERRQFKDVAVAIVCRAAGPLPRLRDSSP